MITNMNIQKQNHQTIMVTIRKQPLRYVRMAPLL
jgi:hypothetical protein